MGKPPQVKIKVTSCSELRCPFYHAGHMGSLYCQAAKKDLEHDDSGAFPDWCPLRDGPVSVRK